MKRVVIVLGLCTLLGGCGRRELEDRRFPTVLTAETGNIKAQEEERQAQDSKYIDYGHVKAVILSRETAENGQMLREILSYLENNPVFARNILIYVGDEETLEAAKKKEEDTGIYLEDLAKNQPGDGALELPLKDLLNYLHNGEASIKLPALYTENGKILPGGSIELTQEAASASNVPIPRKTGFKE
ncbi:MAG: hypothetical protein HFI80_11540 [Lachnospiraceae bacterium]|nr:hypothetical protein [Lachnospiraceae bacterium]MCI9662144.1 hypothetical protein [Lachnospiraceae bacterium]NBH98970.1 hypothetical protein [Lachnospiraceae bacterium]NBI76167.1 hypothetical protein [Lachnospiraceae bacterium]RKJ83471.1 hypothetical protein D7Y41_22460 [Anaerotruncus sp. 1XD22-93]